MTNKKNNPFIIKIIVIIFILLMIFLIYTKIRKHNDNIVQVSALTNELFKSVESSSSVNVSKYIVYGTHFNLEGNITIPKISGISIERVDVIVRSISGDENSIDSDYTYKDNLLSFSTIDEINGGLDLESLSTTNYYIFLKVLFSNSEVKYYSLSNDTEYGNIDYYTLTRNNSNNKVYINFGSHNNIPFLGLNVSTIQKLPENVYDVVIDPGHGGKDIGATSNKHYESEIVLDCAKNLKSKLENLGLKVFLTRDGSEPKDEDTAYNMYDDNGRVTKANESGAKILLSLHMNSNSSKLSKGGVEIYAPSNCDLSLAQLLADNIVKTANTTYSSLKTYQKANGVYVRNFTEYDILTFKNKAIQAGYEPYNINTSTPYLYMIREIGGIATNAFVDGRNTYYSANKYYNSNIGLEGYLIELGYMIIDKDLNNVLNNEDLYMQAISNSLKSFYNL